MEGGDKRERGEMGSEYQILEKRCRGSKIIEKQVKCLT